MTFTATAEFYGARTPMTIARHEAATQDEAVVGLIDEVKEFFRNDETDWYEDVMICVKASDMIVRTPFTYWVHKFSWSF